jgi:hypothetical protein
MLALRAVSMVLMPALASAAQLDFRRVDFLGDLLPKARSCTCDDCVKKTIPYIYGTTQGETLLATDHAALFGGWDGKTPKMDKVAELCLAPDVRTARFGPLPSPAGSWHYLNSSLVSGGVLFSEGERVKAFVAGLVTPEGEPISVPPLHAHHIHVVERAGSGPGWPWHQTDFHLWQTHGDFSIGSTYGIGDKSTEGYAKHLPYPYTAPIHKDANIWIYAVLNDVRTWIEGAKQIVVEDDEWGKGRGSEGWGIQGDPSKGIGAFDVMYEMMLKFPSLGKETLLQTVKDGFKSADVDEDGKLGMVEYTTFLESVDAIAADGGSEWIADVGTDTTKTSKLHGIQPIEFYMEVAFAIEVDVSKAIDVVSFDARNGWPCSMEGRIYEATDAFFRVKTPNYPAFMMWTHVMPFGGYVIKDPIWTHNHHLRSWGMAQVYGAIPNTKKACMDIGVATDSFGNPDGIDWHRSDDLRASYDKFVSLPDYPVSCWSDPDKATNVAVWDAARDGIKPGTHFDRALEMECVPGLKFKKGDHFTNIFFIAPMFEPEVPFIGMHTNFWYFVAPDDPAIIAGNHGTFKPEYDDCASTCGNDAPHFNKETLAILDPFDPLFQTLDWEASAIEADGTPAVSPVFAVAEKPAWAKKGGNGAFAVAAVLALAVAAVLAVKRARREVPEEKKDTPVLV